MIEEHGQWYAVDGESFAHGKVRDWTITYEYDDIYTAIVEALMDDPYATTIMLGDATEDITQFLSNNYEEYIREKCDGILLDDDYGTERHFNCVEDCVTDLAEGTLEMEYEWSEYV